MSSLSRGVRMCAKDKCGEACERCAAARERMKIVDRSAQPMGRRSKDAEKA